MTASFPAIEPAGVRQVRRRPSMDSGAAGRGGAWLLPAALVVAAAFQAGGFFPDAAGLLAVALCGALLVLVTCAAAPGGGVSGWGVVAGGALAGLAVWTLLSSLWSDAPARAAIEYTRVLHYLLLFALVAAIPTGRDGARWILRWIGLALALVALAGLATRLWPGAFDINLGKVADRLAWPVGYWNALGLVAGMALVVALWATTDLDEPWPLRVAGASLAPALAVTAYLTLSRGALVATVIGVAVFLVLGRPRGLLTGLPAIVPAVALALAGAYDLERLVDDFDPAAAAVREEGRQLAWLLLWTTAAAAALRAALLPADRRLAALRFGGLRRPVRIALGAAALAALLVTGIALEAPDRVQRQWEAFTAPPVTVEDNRARLGEFNGNGRIDHWRVALDGWEAAPVRGNGAGTFPKLWDASPDATFDVQDAHSLYLEALAELGVVGLALLACSVLVGLAAVMWRRREQRVLWSAALAVALTWAVRAGADWDWEMSVVTLPAVALLAAGCARAEGRLPGPLWTLRPARVLAGLAVLFIAVQPFRVMLSQDRLQDALTAFASGQCGRAASASLSAIEALDSRTEPFELLGYCDARLGKSALGVRMLEAANRRDPGNWELLYGLALVRGTAGRDPRPQLRAADRANPNEPVIRQALKRMRGPRTWSREARRLPLPIR